MNKVGILFFHTGWTDIFNSLSLIDYYLTIYKTILLLAIPSSKDILEFYIKNKPVKLFVSSLFEKNINFRNYIKKYVNLSLCDIIFHGYHDSERTDKYKNSFYIMHNRNNVFFAKAFYTAYNIDYDVRINYFNIQRDYVRENIVYENFCKKNGNNYILYHNSNNLITNEINKMHLPPNTNIINLDNQTSTFFDFITVIENSKEIHLIDSVWSVFIYLLSIKYCLFNNIQIYVYCKRGYSEFYNIKKENWIINFKPETLPLNAQFLLRKRLLFV